MCGWLKLSRIDFKGYCMQVERLRLNNYRNYKSLVFEPELGLSILTGKNAAGKTNILEALFLCAVGRSHRTRHDDELIKSGEEHAAIDLALLNRTGSHNIECRLLRELKRSVKIDGSPLMRSGDLLGLLRVVMFSPEDLRIIKNGPAERRRFMDMELSQINREYYFWLQKYNHALKQRNALLKIEAEKALISSWEQQLGVTGAKIMIMRGEYTGMLATASREIHSRLSGGLEQLSVAYAPAIDLTSKSTQEQTIISALEKNRARDIQRTSTSVGPHRDDIAITINGTDARAFGSQGQQRTAALALKLSGMEVMREKSGEAPVLLLDDVLSELDDDRQRMLMELVSDCQAFITCTSLDEIKAAGLTNTTVYNVENGTLDKA